jgi:hypothetical protein
MCSLWTFQLPSPPNKKLTTIIQLKLVKYIVWSLYISQLNRLSFILQNGWQI